MNISQVPKKFRNYVHKNPSILPEQNIELVPHQTVDSYFGLPPFVKTSYNIKQLMFKNGNNDESFYDLRPGYVAVAVDRPEQYQNARILQIREDIINQSQTLNFLASARPVGNLGELVHLVSKSCTQENVITICQWLDQHLIFQEKQAPDNKRVEFDKSFLRSVNYQELSGLIECANFLELHPTDWHVDYAKKQAADNIPKDKRHPEIFGEICADLLGDMMASCNTPIELQSMFSDLIGNHTLTAEDKYYIIVNDAWIHGDAGVLSLLSNLKRESGGQLFPKWDKYNPDRIRILEEVGLAPDAILLPIKIEGVNNTGIPVGVNWWDEKIK
jgi:hypothetical protein